jgi:transcription antitermination factor NusA-like protein
VVEDSQLSLAIGKKGQNVRLAAKLTGWRIDIKSEEEKRKEVEAVLGALDIGAEPGEGVEGTEGGEGTDGVDAAQHAEMADADMQTTDDAVTTTDNAVETPAASDDSR